MAALASVNELAVWMDVEFENDSPEYQRAELVLEMASHWARTIANKPWLSASEEGFPPTVKGVVLAAARREMENPRRVVYEVKGPESASYNQKNYPPGFFTDPEYQYLRSFRKTGALWSLSSYRDDPEMTIGYLMAGEVGKPLPVFHPNDPGWKDSYHL
ncbi:head-tail adaptor Ad1 [Mycobacterium phage Kumao]|uniref:Head-to-tail adaptor n=1 Tax=Mycobacterium phage Kumao TaxID=2041344 RepID=A0A2D1GPW9_9CAUD|nr:head-tail adaptor Ad1 [Mycobacterium phage Kumao]ATN93981.1 head-to-tail adaptor [Mycobacterium phage Kumao]